MTQPPEEKEDERMANGFIVVTERGWDKMTPDEKECATFNTLKSIDMRLSKLEKRHVTDKCFSFLGGIIGGFVAAMGIKWGS